MRFFRLITNEIIKESRAKQKRYDRDIELYRVLKALKRDGKAEHVDPVIARYCRLHIDCFLTGSTRQLGYHTVHLNE